MKKDIIIMLVVFLASVFATEASAQQGVSVFGSEAQCLEALDNGTYRVYQARYFKNQHRVSGLRIGPLPTTACVQQEVVGGTFWTVQDQSVKFAFNANGNPVYRADCGNRVYRVVYPTKPAQPVVVSVQQTQVVQQSAPSPTPTPCVPTSRRFVREEVQGGIRYHVIADNCGGEDWQRIGAVEAPQLQPVAPCQPGMLRNEQTGECVPLTTEAPKKNRNWAPWIIAGGAAAVVTAVVLSKKDNCKNNCHRGGVKTTTTAPSPPRSVYFSGGYSGGGSVYPSQQQCWVNGQMRPCR